MRKLLVSVSIVLIISHQIQNSIAFDPIGIPTNIIGFGQFLVDVYNKFQPTETMIEERLNEINTINSKIFGQTRTIVRITENLPKVIRHVLKEDNIENNFSYITSVFQRALRIQSRIDRGEIYNNSEYEMFAKNGIDLDKSIDVITKMFTDEPTYALGQNFIGNLKTFEGTCETKMSNFQLLDSLLTNMRFATAQYYWAKKLIYDFLEISGQNFTKTKHHFLDDVGQNYATVATKFQTMMANASTEVWKCDPENGYDDSIRSINNTNSNFAEMRVFSKYIFDQSSTVKSIHIDCRKHPCDEYKKIDSCNNPLQWNNICPKTQLCPGKLFCDRHPLTENGTFKVCVNTNKQSPYRYHMIVRKSDTFNKSCDGEDKESFQIGEVRKSGGGSAGDFCYYCNCVCEQGYYEKNGTTVTSKYHGFFVDNSRVKAGTRKQANKIVVGARLVVEPFNTTNFSGQVLRIQIKEANLSANGAVADEKWQPTKKIKEEQLIQIQWNKNRRFYLSPVMLGEDEVITGLVFNRRAANGPAANDFVLRVIAQKVDLVTGVLDPSQKLYRNTTILTKSYNLIDVDVPTRAVSKNNLHSSDDEYVDLSLSSDRLDGGQSTVPFIDTQQWSAKTLLAGASLYVRGQHGYGGFLSLKFWTFNTTKYIQTEKELLYTNDNQRLQLVENLYLNRGQATKTSE